MGSVVAYSLAISSSVGFFCVRNNHALLLLLWRQCDADITLYVVTTVNTVESYVSQTAVKSNHIVPTA